MDLDTGKLVEICVAQNITLLPCNYDIEEQRKIIKKSISLTSDTFNKKVDVNSTSVGNFDINSFLELAESTRLNYGIQLLLISPIFKHPKFSEENEFRFILYQNGVHDKQFASRRCFNNCPLC